MLCKCESNYVFLLHFHAETAKYLSIEYFGINLYYYYKVEKFVCSLFSNKTKAVLKKVTKIIFYTM